MTDDRVSPLLMPSKSQAAIWSQYIIATDGVDQQGYWLGWCPIHDQHRDPELPTAQFNFRKGVMRCLAELPCHGSRRVVSLTNMLIKMSEEGRSGER